MLNFNRLTEIRQERPLLHCISNIVSANDCANLALAIGASPVMAQAADEMAEITAISSATVLNTGTPDRERFEVCRLCGSEAGQLGQPLVLDPVGVGASSWRLAEIRKLLGETHPTVIRVNLGEAEALCSLHSLELGVDSTIPADTDRTMRAATELARRYGTTVLLTGAEDFIHDGERSFRVSGGSERMTRVTGTGCMLSVLCAAFAAVEPDALQAAALASVFWKLCAEQAAQNAWGKGIGSFRAELMNAAELTDAEMMAAYGKLHIFQS